MNTVVEARTHAHGTQINGKYTRKKVDFGRRRQSAKLQGGVRSRKVCERAGGRKPIGVLVELASTSRLDISARGHAANSPDRRDRALNASARPHDLRPIDRLALLFEHGELLAGRRGRHGLGAAEAVGGGARHVLFVEMGERGLTLRERRI